MLCPQCQHQNSDTAKFCEECGAKLITACPQCGHPVNPTAKFCAECGAALTLGEQAKKEAGEKGKESGPQTERLRDARLNAGERRQLTVMFCDLVGSTALSAQLDPEDYQAVVQTYQTTCAAIIERYAGYIAQHLGDGLLVYFGYPRAHEDDAQRAVRAGLEIITALGEQRSGNEEQEKHRALQVRIGIHTGLVVVGEVGGGAKREQLALGETPNIAARVQSQAAPNEVVVSAATLHLLPGLFETRDLGPHALKGISTPLALYRVVGESATPSRFEAALTTGLTPLVGRSEELALLWRHWEQARDGEGQVVLLSGEPGIGKSRLVQELKERLGKEGATRIEFRCSPYHQNSALYPILTHLQHLLQFAREDAPAVKIEKLQHTLSQYHFPQADTLSLFASLLSLPHPERYPPITMSPQKQKEKTRAALVSWLVEEAKRNAVYITWEDVHWADPSTLDVLTLVVDQAPTARLYILLTFRPEFIPPWGNRSHLSQLTLRRLGRSQVEAMVERVTGGKALPAEVLQQIVAKTDGVPLFVEELTKTVMESGLLREEEGHYVGAHGGAPIPPLAIPSTLQDSLAARLDRLAPVREIAQMGATLGREFPYDLLHAVSPLDEAALQQGLRQLVEAELLYQRGLLPQATYVFKHALIQDTAYQSLLKSKRQQLHQQIAHVLEERFPETKETQPELVAQHYTEASLITQAIPYLQKAGQRAIQRSANVEAISHLSKGLTLLKTLPDTLERAQQELTFQLALGPALMATKSIGHADVESAYTRARELCQQTGDTPQLFLVLWVLRRFYSFRADYKTAQELEAQLLRLAQNAQDPALLLEACLARGLTSFWIGQMSSAREYFARGIALYDPQQHHAHAFLYGSDPGVACRSYTALILWYLGYPDQALQEHQRTLALARELTHPFSLVYALSVSTWVSHLRREVQATQERVETAIRLATEQGFPYWVAWGSVLRGWALTLQGQGEEGIAQLKQGITAHRAMGAELGVTWFLAMLAEAYAAKGQVKDGLHTLSEALDLVDKRGECAYEAELYRLKGELTLQSQVESHKSKVPNTQHLILSTQAEAEAEACFLKAIEIAQQQQAKSLELRAVMSLVRLRRQQAALPESRNTDHESRSKLAEAHRMLSKLYHWFTEGFDTKDLQEAKVLLNELGC